MQTIWKYPLQVTDQQIIDLPIKGKIISVANQNGQLVLYAEVDTESPVLPCRIRVFGTGHELHLPSEWSFVGTVVMEPFVWHVYAPKFYTQ